MELNKAIQELSDMCDIVRCGDYYSLESDDIEAIDTVLTELDRLQKESISKDKILDKIKEIQLEYDNRSRDNDSFYAYSNEYAHIEEVLKELLEEVE